MQSLLLLKNKQVLGLSLLNHRIYILNQLPRNISILGKSTKTSSLGSIFDLFQSFFSTKSSNLQKCFQYIEKFGTNTWSVTANKIINILKSNFFFPTNAANIQTRLTLFKINNQNHQQDPFRSNSTNGQSQNPNSNNNNPNNRNVIAALVSLIVSMVLFYFIEKSLEKAQAEMQSKMATKSNEVKNNPSTSSSVQPTIQLHVKNGMITWNEFVSQLLANKLVNEIYASKTAQLAIVALKHPIEANGARYINLFVSVSPDDIEKKLEKAQDELQFKQEERVTVTFKSSEPSLLLNLIVFAFIGYIFFSFGKLLISRLQSAQSDMFSQFTKAKYTVVDPHLKAGVPKITFKEVAGLHEAKVEIKEFVEYLRSPDRFVKLGARVPKGALLLGPPGCGKTLLAKAVAAEANVPFFNIAGTEFIEMIGGVGAARVRSLFEEAKKQSPSIIYIDEIDAIGRKRSGNNDMGSSSENDQTLNQLLVSMDGLESNSNVVVLASTNRSDILDKALMRPGRLDRHILIDLPTYEERIEILNVHIRDLKLGFKGNEKDEFLSRLSHLTPRFSGADLANICNEAALLAARDSQLEITTKNFEFALDRVMAGPEKKTSTISIEDRRMLAYRECGHVIISWFHKYSDLILKVSLLSRTKMSSFTQYLPSDKKLYSKEELFDQMCLYFGGRVAESVVFNRFTTKSEEDLKKITKLAYAQVESFGMSDALGNMSFPTQQEEKAKGNDVGQKPYSKKLRGLIDFEVNKLVQQAHRKATETVELHRSKLNLLAEELLKKENLSYEDIVRLIGPPLNEVRFKMAKLAESTSSPI